MQPLTSERPQRVIRKIRPTGLWIHGGRESGAQGDPGQIREGGNT